MTPRVATFLVFAVNGAVVGTWIASIPSVQSRLGLSGTELGLILLVYAIGILVSQQVTGQLLTRVSSRRILLATGLIFPLLTPLPLLAPSPLSLAIVMLAFGAFNTAMDVSMNQHGVALEDSGGKSIFSGLHAGWSIGGFIGAGAVGIAVTLGASQLVEAVVAGLLFWAVVLLASRFVGVGTVRSEGAQGISLPTRAVLPIALLVMLIALVEGGLADWGGIYLRRGIGAGADMAAFAYAALSLGLAIGRLGGDAVKDRIGSIRLIQAGMLLGAVAIGVMLVIGNAYVALLGLAVAGIGIANAIPQLFGAAARIPPHGPSLSAAFTFLTLAFMIGPPVIGAASDAFGVATALGLLVISSLVVTVAVKRVPSAETNPRFRAGRP